jgi:1,2-diacylglycerol 3-alpha-glucosyltransferase
MNQVKPKILVVTDTYYPQVDGVIRFIEEFTKRTKNLFDLTILAPQFDGSREIEGAKTILLETSRIFKLSTYRSMKLSFQNRSKIKGAVKEADVVFVQDTALIGLFAIRFARRYGKKVVFYFHQIIWEQFDKLASYPIRKIFSGYIKRKSIRAVNRCNLVLLPYIGLKEKLQQKGIRVETRVARLGINNHLFLPAPDKTASKRRLKLPDKIIVGYVGRISGEKNIDVLLKAFNKLRPDQFFLLVVGDGQSELVERLKHHPNCRITGFVDNVVDYLQAMDIFVMPSLTETTSLATLEAMSCGLPVIVTRIGFMKEYVVREHNGLFFPRSNPTLLALKIEKLVRDPDLIKKLSRNARKTITYSFSWERSINKIKRLLMEVYYQP